MFLYIDCQSKYVITVRANQIWPDAVRVLQHYQPHHGLEEAIKEKKYSDFHSNVDRVRMCDPHSKVDLENSSVKTNSNKLIFVMAAAAEVEHQGAIDLLKSKKGYVSFLSIKQTTATLI